MKKSFAEILKSGERIYLDGGTGSALLSSGLSTEHAEIYNVERPLVIQSVHEKYFASGSNVVYANTFSCNRNKADLSKYSLEAIIKCALDCAKKAAEKYDGYYLYDCGPTGELMYPYGRMTFDEAYEVFAEQAKAVAKFGADGVVIETISDLQEMRAAILAFKENSDLPVICSMTFEKSGRTFSGTDAESFALCANGLGVSAIGANCGTGADEMICSIEKLLSRSVVPVFAKPNAGIPRYENGKTVYDVSPEEFAVQTKKIALLGVKILGGCCGTDERYIAAVKAATENVFVNTGKPNADAVCSFSSVVEFGKKKPLIIGERVNPTNKPLLKQAIKDDDFDYILSMCVEQTEQGADMLDVNLGMTGIDEKEKLASCIEFVQGVADVPLVIDTSKKDALEKAVRVTNGICVINSVNADEKSAAVVYPIAKKYGSYIIALCLDENGIPKTVDERIRIAERIIKQANSYGIDKSRLIFDPLTMALSVDANNALTLLSAIGRLTNEYGIKTTLGLSNISFGLPNREKINGAFLGMLKEKGVTSVIVNPSIEVNTDGAAIRLLSGKDPLCAAYIALNSVKEAEVKQAAKRDIKYCILHGLGEEAVRAAKEKADKFNYEKVVCDDVIAGLNELGEAYEKKKAFLPQLIAGSEAAKKALEYIRKEFMSDGKGAVKATVVMATVKGDVHDIGKNIVKAVTSNYGYRIIDLGKDVPTEKILSAIEKYKPQAVGLSALMTTTIDNMTETVEAIKSKYPGMPVLVGGAVVTEEYAEAIGAVYSSDAQNNVKILENMFSNI